MKKVCIVVASRANYSSIKSVMRAVQAHPDLELQLVVGASALLDRYGSVVQLIERDGFTPLARVFMLIEGETPATMAKSAGLGLLELPTILESLKPDIVVTIGDRFETISTALAAAYMNIPLAHTMGGEVSGTIDESIRHAITKLSHLHFPASAGARDRIIRLGEMPESVHLVGCPRIDLIAEILDELNGGVPEALFEGGVGEPIDLAKPFLIVSQHPVTTEYGDGEAQITATLEAVRDTGMQSIVLWPNADAGSEDIARGIRKFRERGQGQRMHFFKNLPIEIYVRLMRDTACLVGNSSSGIRDGAFIGTPAVNIGTRQDGRERGHNVLDVGYGREEIRDAIVRQAGNGRYGRDATYGDGQAGRRIAEIIAAGEVSVQKRITH